MSRNLMTRIAVAAVAIPIILWVCYQGGWWLYGMVLLFALVGFSEFVINEGHRWYSSVSLVSLISVFFIFSVSSLSGRYVQLLESNFWGNGHYPAFPLIILFFGISAMLFSIGTEPPPVLFKKHSRLVWGVIYIGLLYPYVFLLGDRIGPMTSGFVDGGDCLLFLFGLLWVGDTAAMGFGSWLGKHKLAPAVSPNKTVEGFIGGVAGALVIGLIMYFWKFQQLAFYHIIILSVGCSVFGQLGDLVESMWKRSLGIKDSSAIIPGHGGVLDRFDSLLFAAPFMFMYLISFVE
ncbi:MAG: phosphatidate cytidylyltransferase [candidate division Zixibacteria bacterium]|nr:phosphatidate cytidylyltransferase [candidate division Zixibacteria bacterium]